MVHLEAAAHDGEGEMVSPAGSGGWQEGEVVEKQEDSEGEETNKMGPNIHRLIGADDNTVCVCVCVCVCV